MSDVIAEHARYAGLGRVDDRIGLSGELPVGGEPASSVALVRTPRGVFLIAARDGKTGRVFPVADEPSLHFERGRLRDRLEVDKHSLTVPALKSNEVRSWIGLARLTRNGQPPVRVESAFVYEASDAEAAWLEREVGDQPVLAWLPTSVELRVESTIVGPTETEARFLLTPSGAALVAVLDVGDVQRETLDELKIEKVRGGALITSSAFSWKAKGQLAERFLQLAPVIALNGVDRAVEVARLDHVVEADPANERAAEALLAFARQAGDVRARVLEVLLALEHGAREPETPTQAALTDAGITPASLAELWVTWEISPKAGLSLVDRLRRRGMEDFALGLHRRVHQALLESTKDDGALAEADAELGEHLLEAGLLDEAKSLIIKRLEIMPREVQGELLPAKSADLTRGASSPQHRVRLLELLDRTEDGGSVRARQDLAKLEPLVVSRIERLVSTATGDLRLRAERVIELLAPGGIAGKDVPPLLEPVPLGPVLLERKLRHPTAREGSAVLGRLQALLGAVPVPDQRALRDYVEPVTDKTHPAAAQALRAAARLLGVENVEGYISRGRKEIGIRSHEGPQPFVLVGGRHLDSDDPGCLPLSELCFAIGTEVAHLRYGHSRVTSSEVWSGALDMSKQGLDLALGVLPLFRGVRVVEQVTRVTSKVPFGALGRTVKGALALKRGFLDPRGGATSASGDSEGLTALNEQLVAAHRVMQLTADRAGLLLARDPRSAVRAMLHVRPDHRELFDAMLARGIDPVLAVRDDDGSFKHQDLAIRIAALLSFYLSDDYARLERHALGETAEPASAPSQSA